LKKNELAWRDFYFYYIKETRQKGKPLLNEAKAI
jgi:hypothetical protein